MGEMYGGNRRKSGYWWVEFEELNQRQIEHLRDIVHSSGVARTQHVVLYLYTHI